MLLGLYDAADRVVADAQAIIVPTQLLISGADWVVHHGPQHAFFERLGAPVKERHVLPGFFHDTLGERDRARGRRTRARASCCARFAAPPAPPDLLDADQVGAHARGGRRARRAAAAAVAARPVLGGHARGAALRRPHCRRA